MITTNDDSFLRLQGNCKQHTHQEARALGGMEIDGWVKSLCTFFYLKKEKLTFGHTLLFAQISRFFLYQKIEVILILKKVTISPTKRCVPVPGGIREGTRCADFCSVFTQLLKQPSQERLKAVQMFSTMCNKTSKIFFESFIYNIHFCMRDVIGTGCVFQSRIKIKN